MPVGGEEANVTVRTWGELLAREEPVEGEVGADAPAGGATWTRRPHWEIGEALDIIDNARGAKIAGSGFPVYKGAGSALQRGLINWFLDVHTRENGFTEVWPPAVVNTASRDRHGPDPGQGRPDVRRHARRAVPGPDGRGPGHEPPSRRDPRHVRAADPLRRLHPCFRREAGAAGKDTRGILRVHQFDKVEMVLFERPEDSPAALEWMTERAEILLQRLGLAYRVLLMSTREMGFVQARKYDLEVWSPGVERWLEVSSCSNFRDYQARRMAIRYRPEAGAKPELVHTLNGSGLALARVVAALLETYQRPDGSVTVPGRAAAVPRSGCRSRRPAEPPPATRRSRRRPPRRPSHGRSARSSRLSAPLVDRDPQRREDRQRAERVEPDRTSPTRPWPSACQDRVSPQDGHGRPVIRRNETHHRPVMDRPVGEQSRHRASRAPRRAREASAAAQRQIVHVGKPLHDDQDEVDQRPDPQAPTA